ncbi:MAG: hypothetical protein LWX11_01310 [Firmicutes bacterium]|nr:hypothetical protein [Bacillota bacterium]
MSFMPGAFVALASLFLCAAPPKRPTKPAKPAPVTVDIPVAGAQAEWLDFATGRSKPVGAMAETRTAQQATAFPDGRVLVTGGTLKNGSTEWFDPATRRFSPGPSLTQPRQGHRAVLSTRGQLVVVGGTENPAPAEVLGPGATVFKPIVGATFSLSTVAVALDEGVLLVDGQQGRSWLWNGTELKAKGDLNRARALFQALVLPDGRVLVSGGWPFQKETRQGKSRVKSLPPPDLPVEIYLPAKGRWSAWKASLLPRAQARMALIDKQHVLIFGGTDASAEHAEPRVERLDLAAESAQIVGSLAVGVEPALLETPQGLRLLAEGERRLQALGLEPLKLESASLQLANGFMAPLIASLKEGALVLGSPTWGPSLERTEPRLRQPQLLGALRAGTTGLTVLDGKVLALGDVVDEVDPRSGALTPLGWKDDLATRLKKAKGGPDSVKLPRGIVLNLKTTP